MEHPLPDCLANGYYEIAKYISNQDYLKEMNMFAVSKTLWDQCTEEQQKALVDCAYQATAYEQEYYLSAKETAINALKDAGVEFYDIDVEAYRQAAEEYWNISTEFTPGLRDTLYGILSK